MPTAITQQAVHFIKPRKDIAPAGETWSRQSIEELFNLPFNDLMFKAQQIHREHFNPNEVQLSTLLSIKTGGCPEDCGYCPQSVHYDTGVEASKILDVDAVKAAAVEAKHNGATRFCMGAAWREPKDRDIEKVAELIRAVKDLDMEACCTLGMLSASQADTLKNAGLDYYNHNLDTAPELYGDIISTRHYQERLDTLAHVRSAGMNVCCGGIVGRPPANGRSHTGAVFHGRCQFHFLRRQTVDHWQPRLAKRPIAAVEIGHTNHLTISP